MRTSEYVEAPYQGVSQAPTQVRLATQSETMDDVMVAIPSGAAKRPPFQWLASFPLLNSTTLASTRLIKPQGEFLFTVQNESGTLVPRLYPLGGLPAMASPAPIPLTVTPEAQAYLNAGNPSPDTDLVLLNVEDYTFILNRKVTVLNGGDTTPARPFEGFLWVRSAGYSRTYAVTVTGPSGTVTAQIRTPSGKEATDAKDVDTDVIAKGLYDGTYPTDPDSASHGATQSGMLTSLVALGYTVTLIGSVIYISHPTDDWTVQVRDGQGGEALLAVKDKVQTFSDLPKRGPADGFKVRVAQQTGTPEDDYFLEWQETAGVGTGIWQETLGPAAPYGVNTTTLPVALVYDQGTASWRVQKIDWTRRTVGDAELSPDPGFIGTQLKDIAFWRGRLALLYNEGCWLTSATDPLRLYPSTLTTVLKDDAYGHVNPMDTQANFSHAVAFKKVLVLWGDTGQAQIYSNDGGLGSGTSACDPYADYECSPDLRPQPCNDRIYFAAPRGDAASVVYEIEVSKTSATDLAEADDLSVSVPRYIPPNLTRAATCTVNYLTLYARSGDTQLTAHLYRYTERQRVQNAWGRWSLPQGCQLCGMYFVNTRLYVLVRRSGVIHLLMADTADGVVDGVAQFEFNLDFKVTQDEFVSRTYNSLADTTTVVLPYAPAVEPTLVVIGGGFYGGPAFGGNRLPAPEGTEPEIVGWSSNVVTLSGDWSDVDFMAGEQRAGSFVLSRLYYRDPEGRPNRTGKLILRKITFDLDRTAYLRVGVKVGGRPERIYTFESPLADDPQAEYDRVNLFSGSWAVPISGPSEQTVITVYFPTWAPASVLGYTWEGEVNPKAMRMQGAGNR